MEKLTELVRKFKIEGTPSSISPLGSGHINQTFLVKTIESDCNDYVLQKINKAIFPDINHLTHNVLKIINHISQKIDSGVNGTLLGSKLELIETFDKLFYYIDYEGNNWRLYNFIEGSLCYESIDSPIKAFKTGQAFGKFQSLLSDLRFDELYEIIPDFHNMKVRYKKFELSVLNNLSHRVGVVQPEIEFVRNTVGELMTMQQLIDNGDIPLRITHNDTKINNILFDKNDNPICIVDLDIVMPGSVLYDFGDAIRTATNTAAEDEPDLTRISMNIELFKAFTQGYFSTAREFLVQTEIDNLPLSAKYITFIMGLRFLTDYLDGDTYYKIHHPNHNLQRAKAQFQLVKSIENQFDAMKKIVIECSNRK